MKILFVNSHYGFWGGVESYIYHTAKLLKEKDNVNLGLFEDSPPKDETFESVFTECYSYDQLGEAEIESSFQNIDLVFIHKIIEVALLEKLIENFTTLVMIHDHDFYCLRHHKYYPVTRKNCHHPFHPLRCSLCSGLIEKSSGKFPIKFISLRKKMELLQLLKGADGFMVLSAFMKNELIKNGFSKQKIHKIHPFYEL